MLEMIAVLQEMLQDTMVMQHIPVMDGLAKLATTVVMAILLVLKMCLMEVSSHKNLIIGIVCGNHANVIFIVVTHTYIYFFISCLQGNYWK